MTRPTIPVDPQDDTQLEFCLPLERALDAQACGGKAANLGRMLRAGLSVPPGFVLTSHALTEFIKHNRLQAPLARIEARIGDDAPAAAAQVKTLFAASRLPKALRAALVGAVQQLPGSRPLAVRSSAVGEDGALASFAGLLDSTLGVVGLSALEHALKDCWASRWSARVAAYVRTRAQSLAGMAVIVQVQVDARFAGVLFTRSPRAGHAEEMLCEYCPGLAERLVAGEITPAQIAIKRDGFALNQHYPPVGEDTDRIDPTVFESLANAALTSERLFGGPQDIEWALDSNKRLWLVQSRPITSTSQVREPLVVWSNANVNENFSAPISPLLYSVARQGYTHYFRNLGRAFGLARWRLERMQPDLDVIIGVQFGRMYYNLSAIHSVLRQAPLGERLVAWFDDFTGATDPQPAPQLSDSGFAVSPYGLLELARIAVKTAWQYLFIAKRVASFEARVDAFAKRNAPAELDKRSLIELRAELRAFLDIRLNRWNDAALADAAAMACYGALKASVARTFPEAESAHLHNSLLKGLTGLKSAEPVNELCALARAVREDAKLRALFSQRTGECIAERLSVDPELAEFNAKFQRYLECWGFRCSGELMLTVPSFQERPGELLDIVRSYANAADADSAERADAQRASREAITVDTLRNARVQRLLRWLAWPSRATQLRVLIGATQAAIGLRERARYQQALLYSRLRRIALAIGAQLRERGVLVAVDDVFFLSIQELDDLLSGVTMYPGQCAALVELRRAAHARFERLTPDDTLCAAPGEYPLSVSSSSENRGDAGASVLHGISVCGGVVRGPARVLSQVSETPALRSGDILVTRQTDPGWAPAFGTIGGLILERGGMLSHGAILAREYGIPTVVAVAGASDRIGPGTMIEVDGDRGDVRLLT